MPAPTETAPNTGLHSTTNIDASMSGLDAMLFAPADQPATDPAPDPVEPGPDDVPAPDPVEPVQTDKTPAPVSDVKPKPEAPKVAEKPVAAKPATPAPKPGTFREVHERTKADLIKANEKIKQLEAKVAKPVDDTRLKELQAKYEETQKRLETAETELKFVAFEKHPDFSKEYMKPMEEAYASGVESVKGFRVMDDNGERHGTDKDFDDFMAIADPEAAWKFAETRFGTKAPVMWQHRQAFVKALGNKNKAIEDYRKNGAEREKQTLAQRQETQRQNAEKWSNLIKEGVEKYPAYFKEADGDEPGNKMLSQGMAMADLAFGVLNPEMADQLPPKIKQALVNGQLPPDEMIKLHSAIRNMAGGFNRLVHQLRAEQAARKVLEEKLKNYEESEPTGRGQGGGKPAVASKTKSWEEQLESLGR